MIAHKHQVNNGLQVCRGTKVLMVPTREASADTVVVVHHAGYAVEPETVKLVLFHPEAQVTHEETEDLMMSIVEQTTVPEIVPAAGTLVEVEVVGAIEQVKAVQNVLARVRVYNIEQDGDSHPVGGVDKLLQVFRSTVARASGEEAGNLVAESW